MPTKGRDPAVKAEALAIAEALGIAEASAETGVPSGTIKRWRFESAKRTEPAGKKRTEPDRPGKSTRPPRVLQEPVIQAALAAAGEHIRRKVEGFADSLYGLAEKAVREVDLAISTKDERPVGRKRGLPRDRDGAAWGRFLVGVMAQALEKAQLLAGKPTQRSEVLSGDDAREQILGQLARLAASGEAQGDPGKPH